ncbi:MAG TPA: HAD family hydrolase [Candidatus Limnocylindria bacterium]|nr:HAD family hydrolase [Candidatus Limnocylindria bacterium]
MNSVPVSARADSPPQLVVFDLAGTTVEDHGNVAGFLIEAMATLGFTVTLPEANAVMGEPKPVAIAQLLSSRIGPVDKDHERVKTTHAEFLRRMNEYYATSPAIREMPGTSRVFETLKARGIKVVCDTGFERSTVEVLVGRLGWRTRGLVDDFVPSDEVAHGRPAPDLIFEAMRRVGVTDASRVAKLGDTPSDLGEGRSAGCGWVVGTTYGSHTREQLQPHHPTHLIDRIEDLLPILLNGATA